MLSKKRRYLSSVSVNDKLIVNRPVNHYSSFRFQAYLKKVSFFSYKWIVSTQRLLQ